DVLADSVSVGGTSTYTFVNVTTNHRIQASFAQINYPPTAPRLTSPADRDTFNLASVPTPLNFIWQASTDPNNQDTLLYTLKASGPGLDTTVSGLSGTSEALDLTSRLKAGATYLWTVSVTDGHTVVASPDTFSFTIKFTTGAKDERNRIPKEYALYQNYPNPFNPLTRIQFDLPRQSVVTMKLYNLLGEEMATLVDHQTMNAGVQVVTLDGSNYSSGIYFYRLSADGPNGGAFVSLRKLILLK
ncbi:MAG: T9SS type A sorting domain-containing protein, partial [Ignavibacteria bacterium]